MRRSADARGFVTGRIGSGLLVLAVTLAACEAALQVSARVSPYLRFQLTSPLLRNLVPDRALGFRMSPYTPGHDRHGYRNQDPSGPQEIVAMGDSMTYGLGAFADGAWPQQLARRIGRVVYNAGVGGYGPCEYALIEPEMQRLQPRLLLVGVYVANDIGNAYASVYLQRRCPELGTTDPQVRRVLAAAERKVALSRLAAEFGDVAPERSSEPHALDGVAVFALVRSVVYAIQTRNQLPNREGRADSFDAAASLPFRVPMAEPPAFRTVFRDPRLDLLAIDLDDPRMREGLRITIAALKRIRDAAAARNVATAVVLLHSKPFVLAPVLDQQATLRDQFAPLVAWEATATARLTDALRGLRIRSIDTGEDLRRAVGDGVMPFHPSDDSHPNADGYAVIARTIAEALLH